MAAPQGHAGNSENGITQDSIHALIDKEIREIITYIRPDDDTSLLILQPDVQEAMARLRNVVSQLIHEAGRDRRDAEPEGIPRDEQNVAYSSDVEEKAWRLAEPRDSQPDIVFDDLAPDTKPTLIMRKLMAADSDAEEAQADWDRRAAINVQAEEDNRQRKEWYFFYGSLMDPKQLQRILGLKETPRDLRPAEIIGYHIRMWGPYPVLLDGPPGNVVKGIGYEIEGGTNKERLAAYETANYIEEKCLIQFGEESAIGTTFAWIGDMGELKEGTFDLKDWQMTHLLKD